MDHGWMDGVNSPRLASQLIWRSSLPPITSYAMQNGGSRIILGPGNASRYHFLVVLRCVALRCTACLLLSLGARSGGPFEVQAKVACEPKTWPARPPPQGLPLN
jgi:hypothetical protein